MKKILLAFALLLIVVGAFYVTSSYLKGGKPLSLFKKTPVVTIGDHNFKVVVASSQKEQEIGLSKTKSLSQDQGMIFLFQKLDYYLFWMKNMKFPIDIIYINNDKIVTIKNNVQIPKNNVGNLTIYSPTEPADKVLEIQAGLSQKYKFKNGDKLKYENFSN
jgi:uncharacterized protein